MPSHFYPLPLSIQMTRVESLFSVQTKCVLLHAYSARDFIYHLLTNLLWPKGLYFLQFEHSPSSPFPSAILHPRCWPGTTHCPGLCDQLSQLPERRKTPGYSEKTPVKKPIGTTFTWAIPLPACPALHTAQAEVLSFHHISRWLCPNIPAASDAQLMHTEHPMGTGLIPRNSRRQRPDTVVLGSVLTSVLSHSPWDCSHPEQSATSGLTISLSVTQVKKKGQTTPKEALM